MRPTPGFKVTKAAQLAAYLAQKQGGRINVLKLVKMLYLADRAFMSDYDLPMLYDQPHSMEHGPVDSITYDLITGVNESAEWDRFVSDRAGHDVGTRKAFARADLDWLSDAEVECVDRVWNKFGHMDQWELVKYTHDECAEWEDPGRSSFPIPYERIFKALGKSESDLRAKNVKEQIKIERVLSAL
jgi:uncharacterized phage-associated protein